MKLSKILSANLTIDPEISDIVYDSRKAKKDTLFVALKGFATDGHKYIKNAYEQGCRAFLVSDDVKLNDDAVVIKTPDTRKKLSEISANFFSHPSEKLKIIGVTGTKGKTTFCSMMYEILKNSPHKVGLIGSLGVFYGKIYKETDNTTPESYEIQKNLSEMVDAGVEYVVIESSSLGLKRHRLDDVKFEYGVFTNLGREHIGGTDHEDFEDYINSKALLFKKSKNAVVYRDDKFAERITSGCKGNKLYYGESEDCDLILKSHKDILRKGFIGCEFEVSDKKQEEKFTLSMPGKYNALNATGAILLSRKLGISDEIIKRALKNLKVDGRTELMYSDNGINIVVDFAHEGMSMENVLKTLKTMTDGRLISLFGSVGGHAFDRRSQMGEASGKYADLSIITDDDSGNESAEEIAKEIAKSVEKVGGKYIIEADREKAIDLAVSILKSGDVLVLCGKGNETIMKTAGKIIPYNEKKVLEKVLYKYNFL
ncbi:MAG: UDP-N-acetylmuramoyl-L-alanyl-D-glutamate--2,6-diaminopimelate ligase [Clostridia bacterium]|nr:UDP-N-acetylmuramoyl-L-alanyl-D-glutamate--2,6-diaminopimelate ligase [Clostridia bacterium]